MKNNSKKIYRDPKNRILGGVCAALARYLGIENWITRLLVITAFLFTGGFFIVLAYIAAYFIIDEIPAQSEFYAHNIKTKSWQSGSSAPEMLVSISHEFEAMDKKITSIEAYVTSFAFKMDREFRRR
ncbi:envelope stress response membrane protein PspC [Psychromonas antarctica]|uniref:envelope stress response membrane protein PspC n=1 Tax=Psychromonas antarctica TaxID=67573 RepID=UPI001EE97942|nr:envelope stress response membrane protein PspC [Psychromonas antarctica]MCG6201524.1 envelope stress response membrane protein PspC [Psychromonas antarctica]